MPYDQTTLAVHITTPLGSNKLSVRSYTGEEYVSGPFHYHVELFSDDPSLSFEIIVGKAVTLQIQQSSGDEHNINGIAGSFSQTGSDGRVFFYELEIYPWLWLLRFSSGCRIYQNLSTPDIVKQVFQDLGFSDFEDKLIGSYAKREYCVQYRETAFDFVSRLMEEEGIFYFFTHTASSHKLVLADDASAWTTPQGLPSAQFTLDETAWNWDNVVSQLTVQGNVTSGKYQLDDYNFETPETDLLSFATGAETSLMVYDFPGLYAMQSVGEAVCTRRLSALEVNRQLIKGKSRCRAFYAGTEFTLNGHFSPNVNTNYIVESLRVEGDQQQYSNTFEGFPAATAYRPLLKTSPPKISGTQVAVVVGKSGEEIWTDQYGRVNVQFFWDQNGKSDENSSCWIRVSQSWAGKQWGGIFLPRVGQEVLVSFLDGNPDRPVITGSLYNASQTVPYALPDSQTKSAIKTNSSKGGSGFNEIRFEDKAGSEEVFVQAQKDMNVTVLNNYSAAVTKDYTLKVSGNITIEATGSVNIKSGTTFTNQSGTDLTNKSGAALMNQAATALTNKAGTSLTNQAATDLTNEAGTTLTSKASASQTVDGGGMLALKGGLVKVN